MFTTNEYFDGKVKSIAFENNNKAATVGVMASGDYVFKTDSKENMTIISGTMTVILPGATRTTFNAGQSFDVPANSSFDVTVSSDTAYLCVYG